MESERLADEAVLNKVLYSGEAQNQSLICPVEGSTSRFAEQKEVNRHVRNMHPAVVRPNVQVVEGAFSSGAWRERMGNGGAGVVMSNQRFLKIVCFRFPTNVPLKIEYIRF